MLPITNEKKTIPTNYKKVIYCCYLNYLEENCEH